MFFGEDKKMLKMRASYFVLMIIFITVMASLLPNIAEAKSLGVADGTAASKGRSTQRRHFVSPRKDPIIDEMTRTMTTSSLEIDQQRNDFKIQQAKFLNSRNVDATERALLSVPLKHPPDSYVHANVHKKDEYNSVPHAIRKKKTTPKSLRKPSFVGPEVLNFAKALMAHAIIRRQIHDDTGHRVSRFLPSDQSSATTDEQTNNADKIILDPGETDALKVEMRQKRASLRCGTKCRRLTKKQKEDEMEEKNMPLTRVKRRVPNINKNKRRTSRISATNEAYNRNWPFLSKQYWLQ